MNYGTVKKWNQMDGWGFIEGDDGYDYFFNINYKEDILRAEEIENKLV